MHKKFSVYSWKCPPPQNQNNLLTNQISQSSSTLSKINITARKISLTLFPDFSIVYIYIHFWYNLGYRHTCSWGVIDIVRWCGGFGAFSSGALWLSEIHNGLLGDRDQITCRDQSLMQKRKSIKSQDWPCVPMCILSNLNRIEND